MSKRKGIKAGKEESLVESTQEKTKMLMIKKNIQMAEPIPITINSTNKSVIFIYGSVPNGYLISCSAEYQVERDEDLISDSIGSPVLSFR